MSKVSVVIPNYNGTEYLKECLASLSKCTMYDESEVIVVDNASTDADVEEAVASFTGVRLIKRKDNGGFSVAVNEGIKAAESEYVILLNNDTTVSVNFIESLYLSISQKPVCFSVQSKMVSFKEPEIIDDAGDYYDIFGWAYALGKGKNASAFTKERKIFASCAGAAVYRKRIFEEIGYFDEKHFAYLEDIDIGYRARLYGYENFFNPDAVCFHYGSASSGSRYNEFKIRLAAANSLYIIRKNQPLWQRILLFPSHFTGVVVKQLFFTLKGFGGAYHEGIKNGLKLCRGTKTKFTQNMQKKAFLIGFELFWGVFRRLQKM